jgi:hypothetical protein
MDIDDVISIGDISTAFLFGKEYGPDDIPRYVKYKPYPGAHTRVFLLRGCLYGQRTAPYIWWETLTEWMQDIGFTQSKNDPCVYHRPTDRITSDTGRGMVHTGIQQEEVDLQEYGYVRSRKDPNMYVRYALTAASHVDDILTRGHRQATAAFWAAVGTRFAVKTWDIVDYDNPLVYCAKRISKVNREGQVWYTLDQTEDIRVFLEDHGMSTARAQHAPMPDKHEISSDPELATAQEHKMYRSQVGSLMYFTETRNDIMYEVSRLSQGIAAPTKGHMKALRRVMAYLNTVPDMRLCVPRVAGDTWHIYSDSDHAGDTTVGTNRSHTGIVILLNGMPIHWKSNKQPITSYSSACAEIYALSECCREARLIAWIAEEMGRQVPWPLVVHVDNAAGVSYQHSTCASSKLRGVYDQRSDWVKELKDQSSVTAVKVKTEKNLADLYTKCHTVPVRRRLQKELEEVAAKIAAGH